MKEYLIENNVTFTGIKQLFVTLYQNDLEQHKGCILQIEIALVNFEH